MDGFDFVIVGGGTAGCVLAARLSENPGASVLLMEAGAATPPAGAEIPPAWPRLSESEANWGDVALDQTTAGTSVPLPRGRVLGGSSAINGMLFMRGHRSSHDRWRDAVVTEWDFDHLLPFFRRTETAKTHDPALRGADGPLVVGPATSPNPVSVAGFEAAVEAGWGRADDISGGLEEGFGWPDLNIVSGRRQSALDAYLAPAMKRGNLRVVTETLVHRLLLDRDRCVGVEYSLGGRTHRAECTREVILAAGAIGTPQILMLSGIGPADSLRGHGIDPVAQLPGVGENLHDHPRAAVVYRGARPVPPGVNNHVEALGLLRGHPSSDRPDLQILILDVPLVPPSMRGSVSGYSIASSVMQPYSRGTVRLASARPDAAPVVDPRYLSDSKDLDAMVTGMEIARDIGQRRALTPWRGEEALPGAEAQDDAALRSHVQAAMESYFHPVGTCRMGDDGMSVVDSELRVRGFSGLRIADASVMPSIVCGNPNATVYAIAERAADLLR